MRGRLHPIGVVLAGGAGRRIGGAKATVELSGRPLVTYPLTALSACVEEVAIVAKADTDLPGMPGVTVWIEPDEPRHPLTGIAEALGLAGGRSVLALAADMPFVAPSLLRRLLEAGADGEAAVVPHCAGRLQPLPGLYPASAATPLREAARSAMRMTDAVAALSPRLVEVDEEEAFFNVNAPEDLLRAAALLDRRRTAEPEGYPNVKS